MEARAEERRRVTRAGNGFDNAQMSQLKTWPYLEYKYYGPVAKCTSSKADGSLSGDRCAAVATAQV